MSPRHLHAPLQSAANLVLKRMGRHWYTAERYRARIEWLAERLPVFGLGADVIAGFPGETEVQHRATLDVHRVAAVHLPARVSVQRPARRAGGPAVGAVPEAEVRERAQALRAAGEAKASAYRASRQGARADAVICGRQERADRSAHAGLSHGLSFQPRMGRPSQIGPDGQLIVPHIYIETYGCQMNVADSELMLGVLARAGYVRTEDPATADVLLVNTCAVRDHAEQRVLGRMGELKRFKRPGGVLGVVGCMAQRLGPKLLERVPQVDLVIGPDGYRGLPELIARARAGDRAADVDVPRLGALRGRAGRAAPRRIRVRDGAAGLRLSVHVLRRSDDARAGAEPQVGRT